MIRPRSWPIWRSRSRWVGIAPPTSRLWAQPGVFGPVASGPAVSRLVDRLADDAGRALAAIRAARAAARAWVWGKTGTPRQAGLVLDLDATLLTAHPDKEWAARTWKKGYGSIRCWAMSITATAGPVNRWRPCCERATPAPTPPPDHSAVLDDALAQLPADTRTVDAGLLRSTVEFCGGRVAVDSVYGVLHRE
jgi:hypothetical protein